MCVDKLVKKFNKRKHVKIKWMTCQLLKLFTCIIIVSITHVCKTTNK